MQPSQNRLSVKLYGSKHGVLKERLKYKATRKWVIHPCSNIRFYWDLLMLLLLLANVIVIPVVIAFADDSWNNSGLLAFNLISDTVFILDLIINFRTGIIKNEHVDEIIMEPKEIAKQYLKTWFIIDFLSSIPMDYIFLIVEESDQVFAFARTGRTLKVIRFFKLLSLFRLLRISRLVRYVNKFQKFLKLTSQILSIFNLISAILLLVHLNACLEFLVPMLQEFPPDCWVVLDNLKDAHWFEQYSMGLFKACSHMFCCGYGRNPPMNNTDVWVTIICMVSGAICYAITIGIVGALIQSFEVSKRMYNDKISQVEAYMIWRKFPRKMRKRIAEYYEHRYLGKMFDEKEILSEVSDQLRLDIINYNCGSLISNVPFFADTNADFITDIITKLDFEIFQPNDFIFKEGTVNNKMYFIQEGIVDIVKSDNQLITTLVDDSYFDDEISLYNKSMRIANAKAVTYCNLFSLHTDDFIQVLEKYPDIKEKFEKLVEERKRKLLNSSIINSLTEEPIQNEAKPSKSSHINPSIVTIVDKSDKF